VPCFRGVGRFVQHWQSTTGRESKAPGALKGNTLRGHFRSVQGMGEACGGRGILRWTHSVDSLTGDSSAPAFWPFGPNRGHGSGFGGGAPAPGSGHSRRCGGATPWRICSIISRPAPLSNLMDSVRSGSGETGTSIGGSGPGLPLGKFGANLSACELTTQQHNRRTLPNAARPGAPHWMPD
jgi:hypothetical protein